MSSAASCAHRAAVVRYRQPGKAAQSICCDVLRCVTGETCVVGCGPQHVAGDPTRVINRAPKHELVRVTTLLFHQATNEEVLDSIVHTLGMLWSVEPDRHVAAHVRHDGVTAGVTQHVLRHIVHLAKVHATIP